MNKNLLKNKKLIGIGLTGTCYELSNGDVLKVFKIPRDISELKKYKLFSEYPNDSIVFPKEILSTKKKIYGHISDKAVGEVIETSFKAYDLNRISISTLKLDKDIAYISSGGIFMRDVHSHNMLYDGEKFNVIDTDEYYILKDDYEKVYYNNLRKIKLAFLDIIYEEHVINKDYRVYYELRKYCMWDYNISEAMVYISDNIAEYNEDNERYFAKIKRR